jgi:hypothetical protein
MDKIDFIKVTAIRCSEQGNIVGQTIPSKLKLNCGLIGAIKGEEILLIGGRVINLGGNYYTAFKLAQEENVINVKHIRG